jgi:hypothetical protein
MLYFVIYVNNELDLSYTWFIKVLCCISARKYGHAFYTGTRFKLYCIIILTVCYFSININAILLLLGTQSAHNNIEIVTWAESLGAKSHIKSIFLSLVKNFLILLTHIDRFLLKFSSHDCKTLLSLFFFIIILFLRISYTFGWEALQL